MAYLVSGAHRDAWMYWTASVLVEVNVLKFLTVEGSEWFIFVLLLSGAHLA